MLLTEVAGFEELLEAEDVVVLDVLLEMQHALVLEVVGVILDTWRAHEQVVSE